ncbi:UNVERIFIED_CONTAM: hypothetical protein Slati_3063000 [Sesamum latifolium]|uniref:Integrase zinc-binding domain-containing protein n=1 Tax=Sesamum latifolium TaxID=2727402 RepID=A0AAW2UZ09_9LAMI
MTKENRLYVPKGRDLRKSLISECHDTLWAGHQGEECTYALVQRAYYWPQMRNDVETYVRTCLICRKTRQIRAVTPLEVQFSAFLVSSLTNRKFILKPIIGGNEFSKLGVVLRASVPLKAIPLH